MALLTIAIEATEARRAVIRHIVGRRLQFDPSNVGDEPMDPLRELA